jgi:uncharacterized protein YebE (UPF0316 family)
MNFLTESSVWIYFFIFFGKILEVAVSTVRLVLINRGERVKGSVLAFFDILLWVLKRVLNIIKIVGLGRKSCPM